MATVTYLGLRWRRGADIRVAMLHLVFPVSALAALVPVTLLSLRRDPPRRDGTFWVLLLVALAGPGAYCLASLQGAWQTGLAAAIWVSVAASLLVFVITCRVAGEAWRLTPVLLPYLLVLAVFALVLGQGPQGGGLSGASDRWLLVHIVISIATYALCTLAAVCAMAVFLQERALKRKQPTNFTRRLPSVVDAEALQVRLLTLSEVVLGLGIISGMSKLYIDAGQLLAFDHKTLLSLLAFAVIGLLLFLHHRSGMRGRRAARVVLLAYLLLSLAYPGVKFVTDVLIG